MSVTIAIVDSQVTVTINRSRLEGDSAIFENLLEEAPFPENVNTIIFDFHHVDYINSLGMAELMSTYANLQRINGKKLRLVFRRLRPQIARVFRLLDIGEIAEIES